MYKPTLDEYKEMGREFKVLEKQLSDLILKVSYKCGKKYTRKLQTAERGIGNTKSDLEELMFHHYPKLSNDPKREGLDIFYGDIEENEE